MSNTAPPMLYRLLPLLLWLVCGASLAGEPRLEGVNILGAAKSAYIRVDGAAHRMRVGDSVAGWTIESIESRSVMLRGPGGESCTLPLNGRDAAVGTWTPPAPGNGVGAGRMTEEPAPRVIAPPPPEKVDEGTYHISPRFYKDREIPEGFKRARTPFGDYLVEEEGKE